MVRPIVLRHFVVSIEFPIFSWRRQQKISTFNFQQNILVSDTSLTIFIMMILIYVLQMYSTKYY